MKKFIAFSSAALFAFNVFSQQRIASYHVETTDKWTVRVFENDPLNAREYTFSNGLKLITSINTLQPRISSFITIRTGSKNDPADHTGLAHYLEHMLFKGTDKYGTLNWPAEKAYLAQIDSLYEVYNHSKDEEFRKQVYHRIDSVSQIAATYAIANEYDKMCQAMGATGTNAFTGEDMTVYVNDIPSNMLHKWVELEAERFRNPVLRLFHTELEAVYEEKNISLDNDNSKVWEKLYAELFPNHNYGRQTTIGTVEHLKNPSLTAIRDYYQKYYVPNNMAVVLCGDFDPDIAADAIAEHFGYMKPAEVPVYSGGPDAIHASPRTFDITGPDAEFVTIGYRLPSATFNNGRDLRAARLVDLLLSNQNAGLIDLNLVKQQKVLSAYSYLDVKDDYSILVLSGQPKNGQSLEEVRDLLTGQMQLIIDGEFDDAMLSSIILNKDIARMREFKENSSRGYFLMDAFVRSTGYQKEYNELWEMSRTRKAEISEIAREYLNRDRVEIFKRQGKDTAVQKIIKPEIHPVALNRDKQSDFVTQWLAEEVTPIAPVFADFNQIENYSLRKNVPLYYTINSQNRLFRTEYVYEYGTLHNKKLSAALELLQLSGTETISAEELTKKLFSLGCTVTFRAAEKRTYIALSGPEENFNSALDILESWLTKASFSAEVLADYISNEEKSRSDAKLNNRIIASKLASYALYGPQNPANRVLSNDELKSLTTSDLSAVLKTLLNQKHAVVYYGTRAGNDVVSAINTVHNAGQNTVTAPEVEFVPRDIKTSEVFFNDYDMVQASIYWMAKGPVYNAADAPVIDLFNQYFGGDMSSVVFQSIRESKALAYSTYAVYNTPLFAGRNYNMKAFVGTQADKFQEAVAGMNELLRKLPEDENVFVLSKESLKNRIETQRIDPENLVGYWYSLKDLGLEKDSRETLYRALPDITLEKIRDFHKQRVANVVYNYAVVASSAKLDSKTLSKYGKVTNVSLTELFGY